MMCDDSLLHFRDEWLGLKRRWKQYLMYKNWLDCATIYFLKTSFFIHISFNCAIWLLDWKLDMQTHSHINIQCQSDIR